MTDDEALAAWCGRQYPRLVGLLTLYVGDQPTAEELAQEALLRACRRWGYVRDLESPQGWVSRVGINLANSWWRRRYAERRANARLRSQGRRPEQEDLAWKLSVRAALSDLTPRQREAAVLRFYEGLSVAETAARMGCAEGTVKTLTHRAVNRLRERLVTSGSEEVHHET